MPYSAIESRRDISALSRRHHSLIKGAKMNGGMIEIETEIAVGKE